MNLKLLMMIRCFFLFMGLVFFSFSGLSQTWEELNVRVEKLYAEGDYKAAMEYSDKALAKAEVEFGKNSKSYALTLNNIGGIYYATGDYEKASKLLIESLKFTESALGTSHPDYGERLNNLGLVFQTMGRYDQAFIYALSAVDNAVLALGKADREYAVRLNNLAGLYLAVGQYKEALSLYEEAYALVRTVSDINDPLVITMLNNIAVINWKLGEFEESIKIYLDLLSLSKNNLDVNDRNYWTYMNNLATLYMSLGLYERALNVYFESHDSLQNILGESHPDIAILQNNISLCYKYIDNFAKAYNNAYIATQITLKSLGAEHLQYFQQVVNRAEICRLMGRFDEALSLYFEVGQSIGQVLGYNHPDYFAFLISFSYFYYHAELYDKALPLAQEAVARAEEVLGKNHPLYRDAVWGLAQLYSQTGTYDKAEELYNEAARVTNLMLFRAARFSSERDMEKYLVKVSPLISSLPAWVYSERYSNELQAKAYDEVLFRKGFLLQAAGQLRRLAGSSPESDSLASLLKSYHIRLSREYAKPMDQRRDVRELEEKANDLEGQLARSVGGYAEAVRQYNWNDIREALKPGEAALEFIHFEKNYPERTDSTFYAALLIRPEYSIPEFIPLFEEGQLVQALGDQVIRKADFVNELYASSERGLVQLGSGKKTLYDLIWAKMDSIALPGIQTIYFSPSGILHRLNLGAIASNSESVILDNYQLVQLNSTRQILNRGNPVQYGNDALIFSGVDYNIFNVFEANEDTLHYTDLTLEAVRAQAESSAEGWAYLNWTQKEGERVEESLREADYKLWRYSGKEASEESFKAIGTKGPSPRILHIATHGFFFPDPEVRNEVLGLGESEPVFKSSDNPMIRSGLILAGGNYAWQHGRAVSPDKEDGILTAYEISQMNLSNTELVVLSACETGLGDIKGNEGVYGLQRAFKIAGAKYLIMSLWQVPDRETMEFMTTFYKNWLEGKMTIPEAFRKTQREMRDRFFNPYSWAGFVLVE